VLVNDYEKACKEFLKGCSCSSENQQEECTECLKAFCDKLRQLNSGELNEKATYRTIYINHGLCE